MNKSTIEATRAEALNHVLLEESTELTSDLPPKTSSLEAGHLPLIAPIGSRWKSVVWTSLWWILGLGAAFSGGWWVATQREHESEKIALPPSSTSDSGTAMKVTAQQVTYRPIRRVIEGVGTIHGLEELSISSKVEGRVARVLHDLSDRVKPGELLLEIDPTDALLAVDQAERSLASDLARWDFPDVPKASDDLSSLPPVKVAKERGELAKLRLQRLLPLAQSKAVAIEDVDLARTEAKVTESEWKNQLLMAQAAAANARLKQADLAIAKQRLKETMIRVPIPSIDASADDCEYSVAERLVSEGTMVRSGTELFKLVLGRKLKLRVNLPEVHVPAVEIGQSVEVSSSISPYPFAGTVARISPTIQSASRTFQVEIEVPNEDLRLKPGGFAKAKIFVGVDEEVPTVPLAGVDTFAGVSKVFVIEEGQAREVIVSVGEQGGDWIEIKKPKLPNGAMVATSGQRILSDGYSVTIREPKQDASIPSESRP